jgi:hypothetical protein
MEARRAETGFSLARFARLACDSPTGEAGRAGPAAFDTITMTAEFVGMEHSGGCHCGNIHVRLRLSKRPQDSPLRACACSFCRSHNTRTAADAEGLFEFWADDWSLVERYRFGSRTADYMICRRCGVYIAAVCETAAGTRAVVNVNCLSDRASFTSVPAVAKYEGETTESRLSRRAVNWMPAVVRH